jgi:hypothetical protein
MNPRTTGILFVLAAALAAFVYFYEIQGESARKEAEEAAKRIFPGLEAEQVDAIWLHTTDDRQARVERAEGGWRLVEPVDFPGDTTTLDGMASTLVQLTSEGEIADPQAPAVYGIGDERSVLHFHAGDRDYGLQMGSKAPVGAATYVSPLGSGRVYTVPTWRLNSLRKSLLDLRDRRVLVFDRDAVERIEASWPGGGVALEKGEDGDWRLTEPIEGPADQATVDSLLSDLSFLRAEGFVDDPPPDAEAGLDPPAFALDLHTKGADEEGKPLHFALGSVLDGKLRLARGAQPVLYQVSEERLADFPRKLVAYRFKELARFVASEARSFELVLRSTSGEEETLRGQRDDGGWKTEPEAMAPGKAAAMVNELARLDAVDIVADAPKPEELAKLGLSPPRAHLRVLGEAPEGGEAPVLADVLLGEVDPEAGIAAQRVDGAAVYRLDHEVADQLPVGLEAFRNRFASQEKQGEAASGETAPGDVGFSEDPALTHDD